MKDLYELAKQFVCMIIAATLSLTVSVVESMLSRRPEWLEKVGLLETQMRALSKDDVDVGSGTGGTAGSSRESGQTDTTGKQVTCLLIFRDWWTDIPNFSSSPNT